MAKTAEIIVAEQSPQVFIQQAISKGLSIEHLKGLMDLEIEWKKREAKILFLQAMKGFQGDCPIIEKTKSVKEKSGNGTRYKFASLDTIVSQIKGIVAKHGLTYSFNTTTTDKTLTVTCKVSHEAGHNEVNSFIVPIGAEQYMTDVQKFGARTTYAKRYALLDAFGIVTGDDDTDANLDETKPQKAAPRSTAPSEKKEPVAANPVQQEEKKTVTHREFDPTKETIPFGKYKDTGMTWDTFDKDYLEWLQGSGGTAEVRMKATKTIEYQMRVQAQTYPPKDDLAAVFDKPTAGAPTDEPTEITPTEEVKPASAAEPAPAQPTTKLRSNEYYAFRDGINSSMTIDALTGQGGHIKVATEKGKLAKSEITDLQNAYTKQLKKLKKEAGVA